MWPKIYMVIRLTDICKLKEGLKMHFFVFLALFSKYLLRNMYQDHLKAIPSLFNHLTDIGVKIMSRE